MKKPKLLLATNNRGKVAEMQALLDGLELELLTPAGIGLNHEVLEDGQTYAENAIRKAEAFTRLSGLVSLADDSGLEVDALDGRPGLHSHRFAPQADATDADRRQYLLQRLHYLPHPWKARFRATVAVAAPGQETGLTEGICEGEVITEERGTNGFGYDSLFFVPEYGRTMAELTMEEKNRLSHRAWAVRNAIPILRKILGV
jgi:XTP/dITP diphosphohydrolase